MKINQPLGGNTTVLDPASPKRVNYFDKTAIKAGGRYAYDTGIWLDVATLSSSALIPVKQGDTIKLKSSISFGIHVTFWDSSQAFIVGVAKTLVANEVTTFDVTPSNVAYIRTSFKDVDLNAFMITVNREYPSRYYPYNEMEYLLILSEELKKAVERSVNPTYNKLYRITKWGIVGDSISTIGYKGDGKEYPKQIADKYGITLNNLAVPGSMITKFTNPDHLTDHMCDRVLQLDSDCDVVTIAGGVNDLRNGVPLGLLGDTVNTTFYGALDVLCINLITRFPTKPKAFFTPIKYRGNNNNLKPYVNAIKEVASKYAIPVFDNFNEADLQPDIDFINNNYFYTGGTSTGDGLHPNGMGHGVLARTIENYLLRII